MKQCERFFSDEGEENVHLDEMIATNLKTTLDVVDQMPLSKVEELRDELRTTCSICKRRIYV